MRTLNPMNIYLYSEKREALEIKEQGHVFMRSYRMVHKRIAT